MIPPARRHPTPAAIRTGLIGFGAAGRAFHAPFLAADDRYDLAVIATSDPQRQQDAAVAHPGAAVVARPHELFDLAAGLDLVVVAAPPAVHVPLAHLALDNGLAVVVDKPLAVSAADARGLVERAEQLDVLLTVFHNRRWDGDFLTVRRLIAEGALGDVRRFESRFEWWKPVESKQWKATATPAAGGGIVYDLGPHLIDQAVQLFGPVVEVHAELATYRADASGEDDAFVSLLHRSQVRSHLWMNAMAAQVGPRFHVLGSASAYTTWGLDPQEAALKGGAAPTDDGFGETPESKWGVLGLDGALAQVPTERGDYRAFYTRLADALLDGAEPPVDPREAVDVIDLIEHIHAVATRTSVRH